MLPGGILKAEGFEDGKYQSWEKHPQAALEAATPVNGYLFIIRDYRDRNICAKLLEKRGILKVYSSIMTQHALPMIHSSIFFGEVLIPQILVVNLLTGEVNMELRYFIIIKNKEY